MDGRPCEVETRGCGPFSEIYLQNLAWSSNAVEPRTGIEFPTVLDNIITGENTSLTPEVSRQNTIIFREHFDLLIDIISNTSLHLIDLYPITFKY